ncbi:Uncharacterised protein [Bacillus freudenreichii]|nr:Uncharacterised protein [Bacillus freudenreichii]
MQTIAIIHTYPHFIPIHQLVPCFFLNNLMIDHCFHEEKVIIQCTNSLSTGIKAAEASVVIYINNQIIDIDGNHFLWLLNLGNQ